MNKRSRIARVLRGVTQWFLRDDPPGLDSGLRDSLGQAPVEVAPLAPAATRGQAREPPRSRAER